MPKILYTGGAGGGGGVPLVYMGAWDANANVPFLASGVGVQGHFYIVSVAGTTNLDGITDWYVGDWAVFNGVVWQQIDNSENPVLWNIRLLPGNGAVGILDTVIEFTAAGTLALEAAPIPGRTLWLRRNYVGAAVYTINGNGKLIDGKATLDLAWNGQSLCIIYDGGAWRIISAFMAPRPSKVITVSPPGFPMAADHSSITAALAGTVQGDVVEVYPTAVPYFEPYPLVVPTGVKLKAMGGTGPTSAYVNVARSNAFVGHIVTLNLESQIEGFRFNGMGTSQVGFLGNLSQRNLIKNCVVTNLDPVVGRAWSFTNNSTGNEIDDCRIGGSMSWGVWLSGGSSVFVRRFGFDSFSALPNISSVFELTSGGDYLFVGDTLLTGFGPGVSRIFNNIGGAIGSFLEVANVQVNGNVQFLNNQGGTTYLESCALYNAGPATPINMNQGVLRMRGCDIDLDSSVFTAFDTLDLDHGSTRTYVAGPAAQAIGSDVESAFFAPGAPGPQPVTLPPISQFGSPRLYAKDLTGAASPVNPITFTGGLELIDGVPFYQITTPRGWVILEPNTTNGLPYTWNVFSQFSGVVPSASGAPLTFGAGTVSDTTTTRFLYPGYEEDLAQTIAVQYRIPRPGTLQRFRMRHNVVGADLGLIVYTVRVNGAPTLLSVSLAANTLDGSDLVNSVVVAAGDLVDIRVTKAVALALGGPSDIAGSMELA